jgi:hypothetical protein
MSSLGNRYAGLQDNNQEETEEYVNTQDGGEEVHCDEVGGTDKEGWEDDIDLEHEADNISEESPTEDQDRRRKVSQGQPSPPVQTFAFSSNTAVPCHGAGRGGGFRFKPMGRGGLTTIVERTPLVDELRIEHKKENAVAVTFAREENPNHKLSGLLAGSFPPDSDPKEKQTNMFTF